MPVGLSTIATFPPSMAEYRHCIRSFWIPYGCKYGNAEKCEGVGSDTVGTDMMVAVKVRSNAIVIQESIV